MIFIGDVLQILPTLGEETVHLIVTDPPYFLDKMDSAWKPSDLDKTTKSQQVTSLPGGMKFSADQGKRFYDWYFLVCKELYRIAKPGAFFFSFSSPRLYHRMTCAMEDAGFLIKDQFMWLYTQTQPKAMSVSRFDSSIPSNWKTPQIKSCFEPIAVAQKPPDGTLYQNFAKHGVGLFNSDVKLGDNMFPANVVSDEEISSEIDKYFLVKKPSKKEKGEFNTHKTVKPVAVCEYLIQLASQEGQMVFDPFLGSGTTVLAAQGFHRAWSGCEINQEYAEIIKKRLHM